MATRKSEWLASIKPILDREEAKRDAKELAKELGDLLEINIDASPENLKQLTDEFNRQLSQMGKQPIVFSEKTLQGIVNQFANAVAEGFSRGADIGLSETFKLQLENLKKQREAIVKEQERAKKNIEARSRMERLEGFDIRTAKPIQVDGDIGKEAQKLVDILYDSAEKIDQAKDKYGKSSAQYRDAVLDAQETYNKYLRMQKTLGKMQPSQLFAIPKDVRALYDKLGQERDNYEAGGGENIPFEEDFAADKILGAFEELSDAFEDSVDSADKLEKQLKQIDLQIEEISKKAREIGLADDQISGDAKNGLKTLQEIEAAYDRISKKKKKQGGREPIEDVASAIEYTPGSESLTTLKNRYNTSLSSNENWETQYQWLVKFVKEYENYSRQINAETDNIKRKNMKARQKQYTALYEELKPVAENAETMLRGIIDVPVGKQPIDVKDGNKQNVGMGPIEEDVANAEQIATLERQAKEDAAAKAKAEAEAAEAAKQKRIEEEKAAKAAEKKRLADEAAAEAQRKAAEEAERERLAKEAAVKAEERQKLLNNKDAIATMHNAPGEAGAFFNSETGEFSNVISGGAHSVETDRAAWEKAAEVFSTRIHKHNYDIAAPSFSGKENDFNVWVKGFDIFKKQMILANKEILSFDFSSLESVDALKEIARKYKEAATVIDKEFDGYIEDRKVGDIFGTADNMNEQMQVRLREALENIMAQFPGVMTSYKLPDDMVKMEGTKSEEIQASLTDKYDKAPDDVKKKYQEIIALQDQIDDLESKTQKTPIDMDPWNATKDQKDQIVAAWREYQKVIQEIAAMPVVETEDDEKRLLELKAKAVSLYETMHQGHLNDVLGDGYAKEYGLSIEDGKQMHLDMQDTPRSDFDKSLGGLQSNLNDAYLAAQKLDEEMYTMMLRADDDSIESLYDRIRQDALAAKPAVEALNDDIEATRNAGGTGTGDASAAELEAAITKTETLQDEVERRNKELADKDAEIARVQAENEARLKTEADEKDRLQTDLSAANQQLADVKHENELYDTALAKANEESNVKDGIIRELREQLANVKTGVSEEQASVSSEELKNILSSIVYNVKIAHDENDKTANKIAIDEGVLESTLKRVFTNVLNPQTEQASVEPTNEPWAREDTLNTTIKGALDQIQTNTSKIGAVSQTPANDVDSTLAQISKNVAEINAKIVKGTKATTKDTIKAQKSQADRDSQILAERIETQKLALKKFKTELETSGRMTDEMSKKIRGLSISLGMVKDNNGLTRWGQKFQQQKLDVGITDIANKGSIAEQNANIKKWISLSKQLGELDAKINSGLFDDAIIAQAKQERELVLRRIDEVMGLINNPDDGFVKAGEANFSGHYGTVEAEKSKQIGKLITQYEKLGQLQARAESSGAFVDREKYNQLYDEVQSETEILRLHEAQNSELLEALQARQENAYISEKDIEYAKEQKRLFAEYVSLVKQIGKLDGIINSDTADAISKLNAQTEKDALMRLADDIRPQLDLTREDLISAGAASMAGEEASSITQRQKALVDLAKQHKELGKLQAQEAHTQVAELQKKIDAQRIVLQLTQEEQDALAQITEEARQDALNKQADKDIKKQATNAKKMAQREAMLGKAGNAVGRAENTWMNAVGLDGELPADFIAEIDNYYQKLDAVRKMHQELKNSDMISEEQKKELIAQTMSINKMTDEIGELVSEYQRLSGDNVQVIGNNTLDSSAGLDAYEQQLKQAVITATNGKAQIKNFDAATKTLTYTVKTGKNEFTEYTAAVRRVGGALVSVQGATKRTETFLEATARKMKELTSYFSGMAVFNRVGQELRRGIQYVREIDLALAELKKVTDETEETYDRFLDTAAKTADKVGSTIQKVVSSTADWARLGSILAGTNIRPII